mmetsp:Transcript_54378/g.99433  ORF Transcript_54378/g.99433 Transcript_54378/m.99433 type:complete len:236 (-) Transcript_54378:1716-2423(-)
MSHREVLHHQALPPATAHHPRPRCAGHAKTCAHYGVHLTHELQASALIPGVQTALADAAAMLCKPQEDVIGVQFGSNLRLHRGLRGCSTIRTGRRHLSLASVSAGGSTTTVGLAVGLGINRGVAASRRFAKRTATITAWLFLTLLLTVTSCAAARSRGSCTVAVSSTTRSAAACVGITGAAAGSLCTFVTSSIAAGIFAISSITTGLCWIISGTFATGSLVTHRIVGATVRTCLI